MFVVRCQAATYAFTQATTGISSNTATLRGIATPNGVSSLAWFDWGTNSNYGQQTSPEDVGSGGIIVQVKTGISGLIPGGIYHYRLVVSNAVGVVYGADQRFTTGMRVAAWGDNSYGQSSVPNGLSNVVALASGVYHHLALMADGTVIGFGDNNYGQSSVPGDLSNAVAIAGGTFHSLALKEDGTVVAWGDNGYGQLNVPEGLSNVVAVAGGLLHSMALRADGTVVAWGLKTFGEATVTDGLSNIVAIAGGSVYSLALKAGGTLVGWGAGLAPIPSGATNLVALVA